MGDFEQQKEKTSGSDLDEMILKSRARELARPLVQEKKEEFTDLVLFTLSGERYGVSSHFAQETLTLKNFTVLPFTPPFIAGIINVRGNIVSIVDMRELLGLSKQAISDMNRVIILHSENMCFGILVDLVAGYQSVRVNEIRKAPHMINQRLETYISGVTKERLIVLDAEKILSDKRLVVDT
ncbi:Positive regulator of CheA protein activity (CheW) [Chitinispirillum alkaliphilum]|nr:Positive regulator of CheA protein activity (CheW) [Chitinispirillum alkaliphilum]